jgi:hypothetical protein
MVTVYVPDVRLTLVNACIPPAPPPPEYQPAPPPPPPATIKMSTDFWLPVIVKEPEEVNV